MGDGLGTVRRPLATGGLLDDDRWLVLSVVRPPGGEEHLLADALRRVGARVVDRSGDRIEAFVPAPEDVAALLGEARMAIRASTSLVDPAIVWRLEGPERVEEMWRAGLTLRNVGERFVVLPASETWAGERDLVIRLAPGPAFGTAEHPSTRSCLVVLERRIRGESRLLDVGTGSGILAIAAIRLGVERVVATDVDRHALAAARANARLNGVAERIELRHVEAGPVGLAGLGPFPGVVANLEPPVVLPLLGGIARTTARGGWIVLAGIPHGERDEVVAAAGATELSLREEEVREGWWAGVFVRSRGPRPAPGETRAP